MKIQIPNLELILKPRWAHKPGYGMREHYKHLKQDVSGQGTTPEDSEILKKLGIKKREKVLAIAAYYASWASKLAKSGAKVDYSDISRSMLNWAKKEYGGLFGKYICSNYELIPREAGEYDWTFTYEACGGGSGLPIAYLRSLLNNKGGILVLFWHEKEKEKMGGKPNTYPRIVKELSEIYSARYGIKRIKIRGHRKGQSTTILPFRIYTIRTNNLAREKAELDLRVLDLIGKRKVIDLEKEPERPEIGRKDFMNSVERLNKLSRIIKKEFISGIEIR